MELELELEIVKPEIIEDLYIPYYYYTDYNIYITPIATDEYFND